MSTTQFYGTGRRKASVARVYLRPGHGRIIVNKTPLDNYFNRESVKQVLRQPLALTETLETYDVLVNVCGGGKTGQAGAIRLGLARALCQSNPDFRTVLKANNLLTRDARRVERKKYGQPGARKRFQFSKR
jgi:small subunit ribosomal protein S9